MGSSLTKPTTYIEREKIKKTKWNASNYQLMTLHIDEDNCVVVQQIIDGFVLI